MKIENMPPELSIEAEYDAPEDDQKFYANCHQFDDTCVTCRAMRSHSRPAIEFRFNPCGGIAAARPIKCEANFARGNRRLTTKDIFHYMPMNIGQPAFESVVVERESFMVEPHQVQECGVEIIDGGFIDGGLQRSFAAMLNVGCGWIAVDEFRQGPEGAPLLDFIDDRTGEFVEFIGIQFPPT